MAASTGPSVRIQWLKSTLDARLVEFTPRVNAMVAAVVDFQALEAERHMKENAPWTDRTGNARNTLAARTEHHEIEHKIILHGGMPYQVYLETRWAGKYSIIMKSVVPQGRALMEKIAMLFERLR